MSLLSPEAQSYGQRLHQSVGAAKGNFDAGLQGFMQKNPSLPVSLMELMAGYNAVLEAQKKAATQTAMNQMPQTAPGQTPVAQDIRAQLAGLGHQNDGVAGLPIKDEKMFTAAQGGVVAFAEGTKKDGVEAKDEEEDDRPSVARVAVPAAVLAGAEGLKYANKVGEAKYLAKGPMPAPYTPTTVGSILKKAIPSVKGIGAGVLPLHALTSTAMAIPEAATADIDNYYKRFGLEPSEPGIGGFARDYGIRVLGAGSNVLDNLSLGYLGGKFRDKFDENGKRIAAPAAAPTGAKESLGQRPPTGINDGYPDRLTSPEGAKDWPVERVGKGSGSGSGIASLDKPSKYEADMRRLLNKPDEKLLTVEEQMAERDKNIDKAKAIPSKELAEKLEMYNQEAKTLKGSRDFDRWMSFAQGFFAMGAGRSPYAMQNIAEGLGVTTKQLSAAEKEFNAAEKERTRGMQAAKDAARAEAIGRVDAAYKYRETQRAHMEAADARKISGLGHLIASENSSKDRRQSAANAAGARQDAATAKNTQNMLMVLTNNVRNRVAHDKGLTAELKQLETTAALGGKPPAPTDARYAKYNADRKRYDDLQRAIKDNRTEMQKANQYIQANAGIGAFVTPYSGE